MLTKGSARPETATAVDTATRAVWGEKPRPATQLIAFSEAWDHQVLCCPVCGGDNLHHSKIEVFHREREDAASASLTIEGGELSRPGAAGRNPSPRRSGLLIYFGCECCGPLDLALVIAQHKGVTMIAWVKP